jgi:hypothetical protein
LSPYHSSDFRGTKRAESVAKRFHPAFLNARAIAGGTIIRGTGSAAARPLAPTIPTNRTGKSRFDAEGSRETVGSGVRRGPCGAGLDPPGPPPSRRSLRPSLAVRRRRLLGVHRAIVASRARRVAVLNEPGGGGLPVEGGARTVSVSILEELRRPGPGAAVPQSVLHVAPTQSTVTSAVPGTICPTPGRA